MTTKAAPSLLSVNGVSKRFGAVQALRNMDFELRAGEVHVLFGENGAGKSTLINIICGAIQPDQGSMSLAGELIHHRDVRDARQKGIAAMFQEFSLAPHLSVEENMFLGDEPKSGIWLRKGERRTRVRETLERFGFHLDPRAMVGTLSRAQQQMVEMAKALRTDPQVLILDEPTASLSERETEALFGLVRSLKASGVGIVYITHRIKEIYEIGDRVTVMRDGQLIKTVEASSTGHKELVELMIGRAFDSFYPLLDCQPAAEKLGIEKLTTATGSVKSADIKVRGGEIVGIAGLVGCGKSEIGRAVFGLEPVAAGTIRLEGEVIARPTPRYMLDRGLVYITSDRRNEGLMLIRSTMENISLPALALPAYSTAGWMDRKAERTMAQSLGERMKVRPLELSKPVSAYSGGNQQKVLIAKALARETRVFIFDEPTVGIDVSARVEVYGFIKELAQTGAAVLMISSDLPEVINMSHRVYVVKDGRVVDHMEKAEISETRILNAFFANTHEEAA